jgi:hypothetical protein
MRTTLSLDDDVATKLDELARRKRPFKEVVNEVLGRGLGGLGPSRRGVTAVSRRGLQERIPSRHRSAEAQPAHLIGDAAAARPTDKVILQAAMVGPTALGAQCPKRLYTTR